MKTPRDLLLARHHPATPQLDTVRAQALAAAFPNARAPRRAAARLRDWWQELFWPARRAWLGLAAVWVVIVGSHLVRSERGRPENFTGPPTPVLRQLLREQLRLRAELLDDLAPARPTPAPAPPIDPRRGAISRPFPIA